MPRPRPFALKIRDHLEHQGCEVFDCGQEGMGWFVAFAPAAAGGGGGPPPPPLPPPRPRRRRAVEAGPAGPAGMNERARAWLLVRGLNPATPLGAWLADWLAGVAAAIADLAG
jgi:hypothetical protein